MKKFQCPKCKAKLDNVNVYSQCLQCGELDGNKVDSYRRSSVEEVLETLAIECPECGADITKLIEEE